MSNRKDYAENIINQSRTLLVKYDVEFTLAEGIHMQLYHASKNIMNIGDTIVATSPTTYYPNAVSLIHSIHSALTPSRSIAVFAANTAIFAELYVSRQNTPGQIYIYEIEMAICQASPMCLIHKIETEIVNGGSPLNLVNEYIYPTMKWNFYEYFGPQYTITNIVPNASASDLYIAGIQYDSDCIQMSQI